MPGASGDLVLTDLISVCQFGWEECVPEHAFGPASRDYHLIHFVASGRGVLQADGRLYPVRAGQCFLILPGEITLYRADGQDPWHYAWVGYRGKDAGRLTRLSGLSRERRVCDCPHPQEALSSLLQIHQDAATLRLGQTAALGGLCRFLSLIAPERGGEETPPDHQLHYEKARWYMDGRLDRAITVKELADFVGLSRSQLYRVFKLSCGLSPKEALQALRLTRAKTLLSHSAMTVEEIAASVGIGSGAQLGAALRRAYGRSPTSYRKNTDVPGEETLT